MKILIQLESGQTLRWPRREESLSAASYGSQVKAFPTLDECELHFLRGDHLNLLEWCCIVDRAQRADDITTKYQMQFLQAFIALFEMRVGPDNDPYLNYYLKNLAIWSLGHEQSISSANSLAGKVRQCSARALEILTKEPMANIGQLLPANNLSAMLSFERFASLESINAALRPYWPLLKTCADLAGMEKRAN